MAKKATQTTAPNLYALSGGGVAVSYSTTSTDGKPRLTFKKGRQTLSFSGSEITSLQIGIGTLVSVVIATKPDREFTTFSSLLPAILLRMGQKQSFRSFGITTVTKTTIVGPVAGVQQTYNTIALRGSAQKVAF